MELDEVHFARLRDKFTDVWKKVEHYEHRRQLTTNPDKLFEYKTETVEAFNAVCGYLLQIYHLNNNIDKKLECIARINPYLVKTKRAFNALKLAYDWPVDELSLIDITLLRPIDVESTTTVGGEQPQASSSTSFQSELASSTAQSDQFEDANETADERLNVIIHELSQINVSDSESEETVQRGTGEQTVPSDQSQQSVESEQVHTTEQTEQNRNTNATATAAANNGSNNGPGQNSVHNSTENIADTMPQTPEEFYKTATHILNYKYEGDPLKLQSFLEDVDLVRALAKPETTDLCLKFIKTRITGRAREVLPEDISTIEKITEALSANIQADSSSVVEGRITALRINKGNMAKFAEEAENLAEAFQRSLVAEKFTKSKAKELTINKTKELCRRIARNDVVEGIIASTAFTSPKEVIAKFITESDIARKKKGEQQNNQKRSGDKGQNKGHKSNKNNKNFKNDNKGQNKGKYQKNRNNGNQGGKGRGNRNEHTIRIVSDANTPSTSENSSNGEQVFRLAQS